MSAASISSLGSSSHVRWALSGWCFFIVENAVLSENRTYLIDQLGDEEYHLAYGTISTLATGSIAYGYYGLTRGKLHTTNPFPVIKSVHQSSLALAWLSLSLGLVMASQTLPKLQIPFAVTNASGGASETDPQHSALSGQTPSSSYQFQVRCPFDFADPGAQDHHLYGLDRISRHPGLWSLGLTGLGLSALQRSLPLRLWWTGPAWVALLGGAHQDSRFRRGIGGSIDPYVDAITSNVPFAAIILGKQGNAWQCLSALMSELKPLNCLLATGAATVFVLSRGRVHR